MKSPKSRSRQKTTSNKRKPNKFDRNNRLAKPLELGDSVALISPGGDLKSATMERTKEGVRAYGLCVVDCPFSFKSQGYFSGTDENRAKELKWALEEKAIKAIFVLRAGYGACRTLYFLEKLKPRPSGPKLIFGYSDITYLHQWVQNKWKWPSFHAPLVAHLENGDLSYFLDQVLELAENKTTETWEEIELLPKRKKETAVGRLTGGTLSLIQTSGPAILPKEPLILCLEDVNEARYRLDRMIWTLVVSGYDKFVKGIVLGTITNSEGDGSFSEEMLMESLLRLCPKGPIWKNAAFGHGLKRQRLLPLGTRVRLVDKKMTFLERYVQGA